jgi:hypothetical protein
MGELIALHSVNWEPCLPNRVAVRISRINVFKVLRIGQSKWSMNLTLKNQVYIHMTFYFTPLKNNNPQNKNLNIDK